MPYSWSFLQIRPVQKRRSPEQRGTEEFQLDNARVLVREDLNRRRVSVEVGTAEVDGGRLKRRKKRKKKKRGGLAMVLFGN